MRWTSLVAVLIFLSLLVPPTAAAAPTWLPSATLSAPGEENLPGDIAVGPDGTTIAVWHRASCDGQPEKHKCANGRILYSIRPPAGSFSAPVEIPGDPADASNSRPVVEFDGADNAIAVWASGIGPERRLRYSKRPPGGAFGPAGTVADDLGGFAGFPHLAVAPDGRAVVVFERFLGENTTGYAVMPPGGAFGAAQSMPGETGPVNQVSGLAIDEAGNGIALWTSNTPAEGGLNVRYAGIAAGAAQFGPMQTIETGVSEDVAMSPSGAAVLTWRQSEGADAVRYAFRTPNGTLGPLLSIPEPEGPLISEVGMGPDGGAVVVWSVLEPPDYSTRWASAPPGGPFGPAALLAPGRSGFATDLAMSRQGTALVLWAESEAISQLYASLRPPGGAFGPLTQVPGPSQGIEFGSVAGAFDPAGNAAAIWSARHLFTETSHDIPVLAAGLDGAGPRIDSLKIPSRVRERRRVSVSINATDVWSAVASTEFAFGDRGKAAGPSARHRYSRPGRYTVTASATDTVGNTSSVTAVVRVLNVRPSIGKLRVVPKAFPNAGPGKSTSSRAGASIRFRLSERSKVRLTVLRRRGGPSAGAKDGGFKKVGKIVRRNRRAGANRVRLGARVAGKKLTPGSYRIVAVAIDRNKTRSRPRKTSFQVLVAGS